jgi:hypothetical protein
MTCSTSPLETGKYRRRRQQPDRPDVMLCDAGPVAPLGHVERRVCDCQQRYGNGRLDFGVLAVR